MTRGQQPIQNLITDTGILALFEVEDQHPHYLFVLGIHTAKAKWKDEI